jgi:PleD family two-component response regulator
VSLGVVSFIPNSETTLASLVKQADKALYMAKQQGRDRLQVARPSHLIPTVEGKD